MGEVPKTLLRQGSEVGSIRPGGRAARVKAAVLSAVLELLAESGLAGVSIEAVSARAGVHKTTIYRRWPARVDLIRDALRERLAATLVVPDSGDIEADLITLTRSVVTLLSSPLESAVTRALVAAMPHDDITGLARDYWNHRLRMITPRIQEAIACGQLPAETDPMEVMRSIAAPVFFAVLIERRSINTNIAERTVRDALFLARSFNSP
ncbi:MAG: TetR/AcrR family transcriptional regulator [Actinomycetota bacterium]